MIRRNHVFLMVALSGLTAATRGADYIVESRAAGQNYASYKEISGAWMDSNTPPERTKSSAPGLSSQVLGSRKAESFLTTTTVKFSLPAKEAGQYGVFATWPSGANCQPIAVSIKHALGTTEMKIRQDGPNPMSSNANQWIELGQFPFDPGDREQSVQFSVDVKPKAGDIEATKQRKGQIYADAVKFTMLGGASEPKIARSETIVYPPSVKQPATRTGLHWHKSLDEARAAALNNGKDIFLWFDMANSAPTTIMDSQIVPDAAAKAALQKFECVRLPLDANGALANGFSVYRAGVPVLLTAQGTLKRKLRSPRTAEDLVTFLTKPE